MANLDTKLPRRVTVSNAQFIRIDGSTYQFHPSEYCPPVRPRPFKVWVFGNPPVGEYFINRLMCYSTDTFGRRNEDWMGYADRVKP